MFRPLQHLVCLLLKSVRFVKNMNSPEANCKKSAYPVSSTDKFGTTMLQAHGAHFLWSL